MLADRVDHGPGALVRRVQPYTTDFRLRVGPGYLEPETLDARQGLAGRRVSQSDFLAARPCCHRRVPPGVCAILYHDINIQ